MLRMCNVTNEEFSRCSPVTYEVRFGHFSHSIACTFNFTKIPKTYDYKAENQWVSFIAKLARILYLERITPRFNRSMHFI